MQGLMQRDNVVAKANELSRGIVQNLLTDPDLNTQAAFFLADLLSKPETRDSLATLLAQIIEQPHTREALLRAQHVERRGPSIGLGARGCHHGD